MACAASVQSASTEGSSQSWSPLYNGGNKLDSDTISYIHRIYCRECRLEEQRKKMEVDGVSTSPSHPSSSPASCSSASPGSGSGGHTTSPGPGYIASPGSTTGHIASPGSGGHIMSPSPASSSGLEPASPQTQVEEQSLHQNKDKNKESLKRKLMMRRSVNELVDQGIYPSLKTPPAFAEQKKQLERAKTGDLLKHKIQTRPDRQSLIQQHILEDTSPNVDPSLQERQRQLKRARLQDSLQERLSNRPGPLELVEGNILQIDPDLQHAIKEGKLQFTKTPTLGCHTPHGYFPDEDSNTSDGGVPSPLAISQATTTTLTTQNVQIQLPTGLTLGLDQALGLSSSGNIPTAPDISPLLKGQKLIFTAPNMAAITSQSFTPTTMSSSSSSSSKSSSQNNNNNSKLSKIKKQKMKSNSPKQKVIKFHEYKGPPSANKNNNSSTTSAVATTTTATTTSTVPDSNDDTAYHILLQQQQLFLQWQLEFQQKTSPTDNPMASIATVVSPTATTPSITPTPLPSPSPAPAQTTTTTTNSSKATKIEDLKVAELKAECKKRSLIVSGPKQALLDRLKPYADQINAELNANNNPQPVTTIEPSIINSSSISSVASLKNVSGLINIQPVTPGSVSVSDENSITMNSPPLSPDNDFTLSHSSVTSGPMSPDMSMDIASPPPSGIVCLSQQAVTKNHLNLSHSGLSMMVDQLSRPPSVGPMDIDLNGSTSGLTFSLASPILSPPVLESSLAPPPPPPPPPPPLPKSVSSPVMLSTSTSHIVTSIPNTQFINVQVPSQVQVGQPQVVWQEDIVVQQQRQIEELRRQLMQSQEKLKELQQQKVVQISPDTGLKVSLAPVTNLVSATQSITIPADTKVVISQGPVVNNTVPKQTGPVKIAPATSKSKKLQTITIANSMSAPSLSSVMDSKISEMKDIKPKIEPKSRSESKKVDHKTKMELKAKMDNKPNYLLQPQAIQQSLLQAQNRIFLNNLTRSPQSFLVASTVGQLNSSTATIVTVPASTVVTTTSPTKGTSKPRTNTLPLNGLTTNLRVSSSSVPSSPVGHNSKLQRSSTSPFFSIPQKEPPRYDDAVKNKQPEDSPGSTEVNSVAGTAAHGTILPLSLIKTDTTAMDDVLEVLIRTGELPPSAAQEPPPTPKLVKSSTSTTNQLLNVTSIVPSTQHRVSVPSSGAFSVSLVSMTSDVTNCLTAPITTIGQITQQMSPLNALSPSHMSALSPHPVLSPPQGDSPVGTGSPAGYMAPSPVSSTSSPSPLNIQPVKQEATMSISCAPLTLTNHDFTTTLNDLPSSLSDLPFSTMDWSDSDTNMNSLDLADVLDSPNIHNNREVKSHHGTHDVLMASSIHNSYSLNSPQPSSPLGLADTDLMEAANAMNQDVSDWLDLIMPHSTSMTPLNPSAPVSFPSDPMLTPKPQDILDMFNMEESDLYLPSDVNMIAEATESSAATS